MGEAASARCCPAPRIPWDISALGSVPARTRGAAPEPRRAPVAALGFLRTRGRSAGWGAASLHPCPTLPAGFGDAAPLPGTHRGGSTPCAAGSATAPGVSAPRPPPHAAPPSRTFVSDQVVSQDDEKTEEEEDDDGNHPADHRVVRAGGRGHGAGICPDGKGREKREETLQTRPCCAAEAAARPTGRHGGPDPARLGAIGSIPLQMRAVGAGGGKGKAVGEARRGKQRPSG